MSKDKYDIAFSYASEQKEVIEDYSKRFQVLGLNVFIDIEHPELFVFKHVPEILKAIYDDDEIVMLIFLSKEYVKKDFTKYESHIAFDRLLSEKRLAIIKLDDVALPWLPSSYFYYDINKYSFDEICQSLCNAIKGYQIPNIENLFRNINDFLIVNFPQFDCLLSSKTCNIYSIDPSGDLKMKITFNRDLNRILFYQSKESAYIFPIAEIYTTSKNIVLENRGFSCKIDLIIRYPNESELQSDLIKIMSDRLNKNND